MSEFDRENEPFFQEIHRNHRRSNATRVVGYIVPQKEAQEKRIKDGKNQRSTKVIVDEVQFGERRSDSPSAGSVPAERKEPVAFSNSQSEGFGDIADVSDDDLPF